MLLRMVQQYQKHGNRWPTLMTPVVVNLGSALSILLLCLHLMLFLRSNKNRNLHHKNMASLCVALIFSYIIIIVDTTWVKSKFCYLYVLATFYSNMASAFWMLTIAFTIWKKVHSTMTKIANQNQMCSTFFLHSLRNWILPAVINAILFFFLPFFSEDSDIDNDFAFEKFNQTECRFQQSDDMVKFVIVFYGLIFVVNVYFFSSSVRYIISTKMAVKKNKCDENEDDLAEQFQLYRKLSLVMGLTWMLEMIMSVREGYDVLDSTFKILNSLEGCFIAVAFTSSKEAIHFLKSFVVVK